MVQFLFVGILLLPFLLYFSLRLVDRVTERRDRIIIEKSQRIRRLFREVCGSRIKLTRVYLQSSAGDPHPYDLFMIEYYGGVHTTDTIWLPVRDYLHASDDTLKQVLSSELTQPGKYTIKDWQEAVYQYVLREKENPTKIEVSTWKKWLNTLRT